MTSGRCPYFAYQAEAAPLDPANLAHPAGITMFPYCRHKHSPARASIVFSTAGGSALLKCGGDLSKCQVPRELRLDVA